MLIVSKFHDYYDVGMRSGVDKGTVYKREEQVIVPIVPLYASHFAKTKTTDLMSRLWTEPHDIHAFHRHTIFFCGKVYFCYELEKYGDTRRVQYHDSYWCPECKKNPLKSGYFAYDLAGIKALLTAHRVGVSKNQYTRGLTIDQEIRANDNYCVPKNEVLELHITHKSPVMLLTVRDMLQGPVLILNPCLKSYEFYRVVDAFTAYQEIAMFLSGVIGAGEKDTVEISEKDKLKSHGFDPKWSFRKESK